MATTTPNYGWPVPTSTDLVKNGATAIEALGDAIDSTVFGLGSSGFTLISTTTIGSAVSSIVVSNCFSASYDVYKIYITAPTSVSANQELRMRLRTGSTSATGGNYYYLGYNATTSGLNHDTNSTQTSFIVSKTGSATPSYSAIELTLLEPFAANTTKFLTNIIGTDSSLATRRGFNFGGFHDVATSYESLEFVTDTGTITGGKIRVYGLKN